MGILMLMVERVWRLRRRITMRRLARAISEGRLAKFLGEKQARQDFLLNLRSRDKPRFFFCANLLERKADSPHTARARSAQAPGEGLARSQGIIQDANEIGAHNFDLLGSGKKNVDREPGRIDWHRDFKSGEKWENTIFYADVRNLKKAEGSDIKVPWELSRFQHLPTLGKAYWLTSDEKYAREFTGEIKDWIENNPPLYGVNWTSTMEVAIRAVNWVWGFYFFRQSPEVDDEFLLEFLKSLYIHGKFITRNLEKAPWVTSSNHYLSNLVGLVYLGWLFPEFREARKWRDFGIKEMVTEMRRQVYPDGVDYEGSLSYHRLVAELFLSATLLCLKNGITFPGWYMKRLEKMIEFIAYYTKPDGATPQIGDNDDGRLLILANYGNWNRLDHRYLLSVGSALFHRPDLRQIARELSEEARWLLGEDALRESNRLGNQKGVIGSKAFPSGGFYIMRSDNLYMIVDCVPADPKAPAGHKHNSRLSFELFAHDQTFIIDPGAYIYTSDREMRNLFRSTRYHNTVVVDGEEQNSLDKDRVFNLGLEASVRVNRWESTEEYDLLDAEHHGYNRLKEPVIHRRLIACDKPHNYWLIRDVLTGRGFHRFDLYFHFAPGKIELDDEFRQVVKTKTEGTNLAIIPLNGEDLSVEIEKGWVSYRYGRKVEVPIVRYHQAGRAPTEFGHILYPFKGEIDIGEVISWVRLTKVAQLLETKV